MKLRIINGPNINLLGLRELELYGRESYEDLLSLIQAHADTRGVTVSFYQSNHEGDLVDAIQDAYFSGDDGIVINPAAYTHTSIAIADAVKAVGLPTVEIHITAVEQREAYRQISYLREAAVYTITGRGLQGYLDAIDYLIQLQEYAYDAEV